jgi:hypothetical protein
MEKRNLNETNPKLNIGDHIILIYMFGDDVPILSKGIVTGINNQPKFKPTDSGMGYWVEFYDSDTNEFISKLTMIPEDDIWVFDKDYYENENLKESLFNITKKNINKVKL